METQPSAADPSPMLAAARAKREIPSLPRYAELHCLTNFSFLHGASHAEELVVRATELGYAALAITDECSLAGVVRAHTEAKTSGLKLLIGASFVLDDGFELVLIALDREGYGHLSELVTLGRMRCEKGRYRVKRADLDGSPQDADDIPEAIGSIAHLAGMPNCIALWIPRRDATDEALDADARWFAATFPPREPTVRERERGLHGFDPRRAWIAVRRTHRMDDGLVLKRTMRLGARTGLPLVATGHVLMHARSRKPLQDTMTAIRLGRPIAECGDAIAPNAERHLRSRVRLSKLFDAPLLEASVTIADQCDFSLSELGYQYPKEIVPDGETQTSYLRRLTDEGLASRFPKSVIDGLPLGKMDEVRRQIDHELALIAELRYEAFFLTVHDIVRYARSVGILCQGRGSAANSAVCYCLGITEVNPALQEMLFERFLTKERNEPPDIDVDFEHQRREEVIQYIYDKYGRHRTALAATVIAYRTRSAIRDVGKALGLDPERVDRLSASHAYWDGGAEARERLEENGFDPDSPMVRKLTELTATLRSFPRHLSQHVGGFVISADKLSRMVPIENAAMEKPRDWDDATGQRTTYAGVRRPRDGTVADGDDADVGIGTAFDASFDADSKSAIRDEAVSHSKRDFASIASRSPGSVPARRVARYGSRNGPKLFPTFRSVIQWDKDDLEELGLLKVDVLALGMLSAVRRALDLCSARYGRPFEMIDVPKEDRATYDMICAADTVGVFQIESRAQMSMLPRLLPRTFYDLVVEVAIVRPGPIQGGMVHPYLKAREARRRGETVTYPSPAVKAALERTLGVPIFQEQVMQLMMLAADFTAGEADKLRRAMAAWKRKGGLGPFQDRIVGGMVKNGYDREYAERIFKQVEGFGEYGFPESHAASFAFLVYISCWIKCHEPAAFLAAMLNSQPLGFYSPSQLIQDAQRHAIDVRPIDVTVSDWDATLEERTADEVGDPSKVATAESDERHASANGRRSPSGERGGERGGGQRDERHRRIASGVDVAPTREAERCGRLANGAPSDRVAFDAPIADGTTGSGRTTRGHGRDGPGSDTATLDREGADGATVTAAAGAVADHATDDRATRDRAANDCAVLGCADLDRVARDGGALGRAALRRAAGLAGHDRPALDRADSDRATSDRTEAGRADHDHAAAGQADIDQADVERAAIDRTTFDRAAIDRSAIDGSILDYADVDRTAIDRADDVDHSPLGCIDIEQADVHRAVIDRADVDRSSLGGLDIHPADVDCAAIDRAGVDRATLGRLDIHPADVDAAIDRAGVDRASFDHPEGGLADPDDTGRDQSAPCLATPGGVARRSVASEPTAISRHAIEDATTRRVSTAAAATGLRSPESRATDRASRDGRERRSRLDVPLAPQQATVTDERGSRRGHRVTDGSKPTRPHPDADETMDSKPPQTRRRPQPAVRLGLNSVGGLSIEAARRIVAARRERPFTSVDDLGRRAGLTGLELEALAAADAFTSIAGSRRMARWEAAPHRIEHDLMRTTSIDEPAPTLRPATEAEEIVDDYASTGFTLRRHPLALLRPMFRKRGLLSARELQDVPDGRFVRTTGLVTVRQRPGTAKGTIFLTLEDETGVINVIVWNHVIPSQRRAMLSARLLTTHGTWQRQGPVRHLLAKHFEDDSRLIGRLAVESRDFH